MHAKTPVNVKLEEIQKTKLISKVLKYINYWGKIILIKRDNESKNLILTAKSFKFRVKC